MSNMCLIVTPTVEELANKIQQSYPEACKRIGFNNQMCAEWIGLYNNDNSKDPDNIPEEKSLVNHIEKLRNKEGKSFLRDLEAEERQVTIEQEMQEIKSKAIADGTFMKAPNGKDTNLTEKQWLQVRTKNFINWFGDWINDPANASKVVDENGEPFVAYTGTTGDFTIFDSKYSRTASKGFFFTVDRNVAASEGKVKEVFLNIRNLKEEDTEAPDLDTENGKYDGVSYIYKGAEAFVVWNPNQIKSATDNNGGFSTKNDNILASPQNYEEVPVEVVMEAADAEAAITAFDSRESSDPDLDKKFDGKTDVSVSEMLNSLIANNTPFEGFVKALQDNIGKLGDIRIQLVPNSNAKVYGIAGVYSTLDNTIYINRNANYKGKDGKVDNTIIHEIIHAIVANSLNTNKHREELGKLFDEAKEKILKKYGVENFDELPEYLRNGRLYGLQNLDEFAAEFFTNSEFILELNDENTFGNRSDKKSLFNRLVEWIKSLLPKGVTDTYKRSGEILEDIILNSGGSIQNNRNLLAGSNSAANTQSIKLSTPESPLQVYSDGSDFKGTGNIGYGSVFELSGRQYGISGTEENEEVKKLQELFPDAKFSNPTMEMLALATTLEYFANRGNGENIVINQDYKGACNYQGLWEYSEGSAQRDPKAWKAKEPYIKHLVDRSVAAIEKITRDGGSVKINWVRGHQTAGTEQARMNDAADRYAKSRNSSNTMDDAYPRQQQTQQSNLPDTETNINIFAGTNENADLSNFAERPLNFGKTTAYSLPEGSKVGAFTSKYPIYHIGERTYSTKQNPESGESFVFDGLSDLFSGRRFKTVEGAFQAAKLVFTHPKGNGAKGNKYWQPKEYTQRENSIDGVYYNTANVFVLTDEGEQLLKKFQEASGAQARSLGRQVEGLDRQEWDANSSKIMKAMIGRSFEANTQALQRLLATGNATLTHTQDRGKWGTEFPRLLMEVREELRMTSQQQSASTIESRFKQGIETLAGYYEGGGRLITDDFPGVPKELDDKLNNHFMRGEELSDDDYRELAKYVSVVQNTDANTSQSWPYIAVSKQQTQQHPGFNVSKAEFYSGAAMGSDTAWATEARKLGIKVTDYTVGNYETLSPSEKAKYDAEYKEVARTIGRNESPEGTYTGKLLRRDMMQADSADAIFAIGTINSRGYVDGGTGYATTRGIIRGIPVFVYDRRNKQWKIWSESSRKFINTSEPMLTPHAAVIGTRGDVIDKDDRGRDIYDINEEEKQVIRRVLANTVGQQASQPSLSPSQATTNVVQGEPQQSDEGFEGAFAGLLMAQEKTQPQKEPLKELSRPETASLNSSLKTPSNTQKEFYNAFSPAQITARAKMVSRMFSDIIDDTILDRRDYFNDILNNDTASEEDKEAARESLKVYNDPILARTAAVDFLTYSVIMDRIKDDLSTQAEYATDDVVRQKLENTITFFDQIANEAAKWIDEEEGIRKGKYSSSDEEEIEDEEYDDKEDESADGNEGFVTKERFVNPFTRLSRQVKRVCSGIETGQKDDLGNSRTYSQGFIYSALMSYLSNNIENADDFIVITRPEDYVEGMQDIEKIAVTSENYPYGYPQFPALEKMKNKYPWAEQIIARLVKDYRKPDEDDADATQLRFPSTFGTLASQFYTNFRCTFIPYGRIIVGTTKEGKAYDGVVPLNYDMEERSQLDELADSYNNGITYSETSIYNMDKTLNQKNAGILSGKLGGYISDVGGLQNLYYAYKDAQEEGLDIAEDVLDKVDDIIDAIKSFGINITRDNIAYLITDSPNSAVLKSMLADLKDIADTIVKMNPDNISEKNYLTDLKDKWRGFFKGRGMVTETKMMQSFYDPSTKKTRYSYSTDNYLQKTMRMLFGNTMSKEERQQYINEHFGKYEWYRDQSVPEGHGWKLLWLEHAYNDDNPRAALPYLNINSVEDTTGPTTTVHDYRNWSPDDIYRVIIRSWNTGSDDYAFYLCPIFADSPMSMTVRGPKYTMEQLVSGTYDAKNNYIESGFLRIVDQELKRIDYVTGARRTAIENGDVLPIANYEKRGARFCIIPELNERRFGPRGDMTLIEHLNAIKNEYDLSENKSAGTLERALTEAKISAIEQVLENRYNEFFSGIPASVLIELNEGKELTEEALKAVRDSMLLPYINMVYAGTQIVELTVVDTAFSKNSVDFQKRFKEVYASGRKPNTNSRYGKKTERVILVADEEITSRSYSSIEKIIDKGVKDKRLKKQEADYILSSYAFLKGESSGINVSDAQALRSLSSFRSILDMYGMWNDSLEESFQRITNGDWNMEDFNTVFQTLKPFLYSVIEKNSGLGEEKIPVPVQHKNSELALLAMYDMISGGLRNSEKLKGINKFLEETKDSDGNPIGDMIQFESAGKSGNQGVVNINYSHSKVMDSVDTESVVLTDAKGIIEHEVFFDGKKFKKNTRENSADNFDEIKSQLTEMLKNGKISQEIFNRVMEYYQPSASEVQKTLEDYTTIKDENGTVTGINPDAVQEISYDDYMIVQPTPQHHMDTTAPQGSQGRNIIVADLPEDFKLSLDGRDKSKKEMGKEELIDFYYGLNVENLIQNYDELKNIFKSNKSLRDTVMDLAMSNPTYGRDFAEAFSLDGNGDFVLSPNSPTIFRKVQQLANSVIKRRIAVQKVDGAALIQASGVGLSDELNLVFDENGKLAGAECYLPATSRKFYEALMKEVTINGKKVKVLDPVLLEKAGLNKAIGYRIPTENKSSMLPIIIKGFAPQQNGSSIFLPAEITTLSGSDFDVDKMFVMLSSFSVSEFDKRKAREDFAKTNAMFDSILEGFVKAGNIQELDEDEIEDIDNEAFKEWFAENKEKYRRDVPKIIKYNYDFSKSPKENGRKARNTMLVQIMYKILTSQEGSEAMFNPQNFSGVVEAAKMMSILSSPTLLRAYMEENDLDDASVITALLKDSKDNLVDFVKEHDVDRAPIYPQTFEYFHHQNMTGDALLAMFALQVSAAAKFQRAVISIKPNQQFTINGRKITDVDEIMNGLGEHRLKNVSQFVGACADNGKDPNLSDFGATRNNAKVIAYLLRAGLSIKEAALIVNQPLMRDNKKRWKLAGKKQEWKDYPVTSEELAEAILTGEGTKAIAILCSKVLEQADALSNLTRMSRADSPNGGLPETFAKARVYKHMVDKFNGKMNSRDFPFFPIQEALSNRKVDLSRSEDEIREAINSERMSMLQGFYSLGIQSFDTLLSPFFSMLDSKFDKLVVSPILANTDYDMSSTEQEELMTALYDDYITFALSEMPMFGNEEEASYKEKREYYLTQFPKDYVRILSENPDIKEAIGNIIVNVDNRLVHPNSAQLEKGQRDEIMRRITSLVYLDNPVASQLVKDLFAYSYYADGLQHTSRGFSTLLSTQFVSTIDGYNDALKGIIDGLDEAFAERFMSQFVNNHSNMAVEVKLRDSDTAYDDSVTIDRHKNNGVNNPFYSNVYPYKYIKVDGIVYRLMSFDADFAEYGKMPRFGSGGKLYNASMDNHQMASEFPYIEESSASDPFGFDDFGDVEFGYGVHEDNSEELSMETDSTTEQESSDTSSDVYDNEGKGQLNNMC